MSEKDYSVQNINKFIMSLLEGKDSINFSETKIKSYKDFMSLFIARCYSQNENITYKIIPLGKDFIFENNVIEDCKIIKK